MSSPVLEHALAYARLGWRLLPVHGVDQAGACSCERPACPAPGKHPRLADWTRLATSDVDIIRRWWSLWPDGNLGLATGHGLIDIEVDARHDGAEHLTDLEQRLGPLPDTVTWQSGGGGAHRLFSLPDSITIGNAASIGGDVLDLAADERSGIDVRGDGGQAVLPPSRHASGQSYRWTNLTPDSIAVAPLPEQWLSYLAERAARHRDAPVSGNPIPDGARNSALARLGGAMRRVGMTEAEIAVALARANADRCRPSLPEEEVAAIARSIARYEPDQVATAVTEGHWHQDQAAPASAITPAELLAYDTSDDPNTLLGRRWLCRSGACLVVGQTGIGKSSFTVQAAITWALGLPLFGIAPTRPLRSLIIQAENDTGDLAEMFRGVVTGLDCAEAMPELEPRLRFVSETGISGAAFHAFARGLIATHQPDLVWIDPLFAFLGGNASEQQVVSAFLRNGLGAIAQETGVAWMVVHHTNKPAKDGKAAGVAGDYAYLGSGSAELANWARAVLVLREVGDDLYELRAAKRGRRSGLVDDAGTASTEIFLRHGERGICWQRALPAQDEQAGIDDMDVADIIEAMEPDRPYTKRDLRDLIMQVTHLRRGSMTTQGKRGYRLLQLVAERTRVPDTEDCHRATTCH